MGAENAPLLTPAARLPAPSPDDELPVLCRDDQCVGYGLGFVFGLLGIFAAALYSPQSAGAALAAATLVGACGALYVVIVVASGTAQQIWAVVFAFLVAATAVFHTLMCCKNRAA